MKIDINNPELSSEMGSIDTPISGIDRNTRKFIRKAINWYASDLIPWSLRQIHYIHVTARDLEFDEGLCIADIGPLPEGFKIVTYAAPNRTLLAHNLAHEMVHVKQYVTGQMWQSESGFVFWESKVVEEVVNDGSDAYERQPWEREAFARETDLTKRFMKHMGLHYNANALSKTETHRLQQAIKKSARRSEKSFT